MTKPRNYVDYLESAIDGTQFRANEIQTMHEGRPLWVKYDLDAVGDVISKEVLRDRLPSMWRYRELLPVGLDEFEVTLGEGMSPVLSCCRLAAELDVKHLWVKDESQLPTGSFKSRGLAMAITMAKRFGVQRVAIPTAGNAGGAAAAYAARAGMQAFVFMPQDTPIVNQYECVVAGARTYRVDGLISDCGRIVRQGIERMNWFDLSTLKEPYRIEGKKTMGLELAEQFGWKLPDVIFYPTGGGTGLIGMWKAFNELRQLGWLESDTLPKMVAVQSDGCAPIVRAYEQGERFATPFENAESIARGIRVPAAVGDFMILDAVRESDGIAIAVEEGRIRHWMNQSFAAEGIAICPEAAACVGAIGQLRKTGWLSGDERMVVFNTGAAQKYVEAMANPIPSFDPESEQDWNSLSPCTDESSSHLPAMRRLT